LFFTDRQVIFICGTRIEYEADNPNSDDSLTSQCYNSNREPLLPGWFANAAPLEAPNKMDETMEVLVVYSTRALSFDADALNAILGALNSYAIHDVYHIWGVPFKRSVADYSFDLKNFLSTRRKLDIALLWHRNGPLRPGARRSGFPSWSPLGWKVPIRWSMPDNLFYVSAETAGIRVKSDDGLHELSDLANKERLNAQEVSQYLELEARTAPCRLCTFDMVVRDRVGIAFPLGNGWEVVAEVTWDSKLEPGNETVLKGILLPGVNFMETSVDNLYAHVLILEQHQHHYERIGLTRLPAKFGEVIDPYQFFSLKDKFGKVYDCILGPDLGYGQHFPIEREDVPPAVMVKYWWWTYFKPETIILG